jgi:hypothetical protein
MDETTNLPEEVEVEAAPTANTEDTATELDDYGNPVGESDGTEEDSDDSEPESDLEEIEIDGKTYKVPKDAALRHADYTRKTQEVAELRKAAEATIERLQAVSQEETQALTHVAAIDARLSDYANIDWDAWEQTSPLDAQRAWRQFTQLKEERGAAVHNYAQARQNAASIAEHERATRLEQGHRELSTKIPGWGQDKAVKLLDFGARAYGFSREELGAIDDPRMILALNDAFEIHNAKKAAVTRKQVAAQQAIKPAAKVPTGGPAVKPMTDRASTDAWMKARQAQLAKR